MTERVTDPFRAHEENFQENFKANLIMIYSNNSKRYNKGASQDIITSNFSPLLHNVTLSI